MSEQEPRKDKRWMVGLLAGLGILAVTGILWLNQLTETDHARQGCERLDIVRTTLSVVLDNAAGQIEASLKDPASFGYKLTPEIQKRSEATIRDYRHRADALNKSVAPYGTNNLAGIDCEKAYPNPSLFGF